MARKPVLPSRDGLWQVTASHFCAGFAARSGFVVDAVLILGWTKGHKLYIWRGTLTRKVGSSGELREVMCNDVRQVWTALRGSQPYL